MQDTKEAEVIRPTIWDEYVGQIKLKDRLRIHIDSSILRDARLDHILLVGPPGCGKTTLASIIANELDQQIAAFVGPVDLKILARVMQMEWTQDQRGIMFLDEIHEWSTRNQEYLLSVLEDSFLQLSTGRRVESHNNLTVIGATTEPEKIIAPLYDRFPIKPPFDEYTNEEMAQIVQLMGKYAKLVVSDETAAIIALSAGGVPRNARSMVIMARDMALTRGTMPTIEEVRQMCRVTKTGLTEDHVRYITVLTKIGGTAGLDIISNHLRLPKPVLLDLERLMIQQKLIEYTKAGRELTETGWNYLKENT